MWSRRSRVRIPSLTPLKGLHSGPFCVLGRAAPGASDPFACASGSADEDAFYGSLTGRLLKLTPRIGADALARELARRFGSRFTSSPRRQVRCPRRGILKATERSDDRPGMAAHALCNFEFRQTATTIRAGSASVVLASGVPQITDFASRKRASALESCGIFGDHGAGSLRWGAPPVFGFFIEVWAQRVPCLSARPIARGWNGNRAFRGYRCQVVERRYEFSAVRCTRAGKRVVRWETGA